MRIVILFFLLIHIGFTTWTQEMNVRPGVKGIWVEPASKEDPSFQWKASWIWLDDINSNTLLTRRTFEFQNSAQKATLRITSSSQYQLYVNGQYICRGPARSAPHHQHYDILDITGVLQPGPNTLAVRVHHMQQKKSYHHQGRAGLLAQLDILLNDEIVSFTTDRNWKVSADPSWDNNSPTINRFQPVVSDRVDMRKYIADWTSPEFNDSMWADAYPLMRNVGWPSPQKNAYTQALTPPWTSLIPRDLPYLKETDIRVVNLIEAWPIKTSSGNSSYNDLLSDGFPLKGQVDGTILRSILKYSNGEQALTVPPSEGEAWFLLFDFGEVLNGMPKLEIEGSEGTTVEVLCSPFIVDNQFTQKVVDSDFRDQIILSGKKDVWEATYFKPTRYMALIVSNEDSEVQIHSAGLHSISFPFQKKGSMSSSDAPWVQEYFDASAKTIQVCTTDGYTDNYRERRQYAQTGYYAALGNYWTFADYSLQRRYLVQVAQEQQANGIMPAYAPLAADDYMIILDSNCLWIRSLRNYLLYSGDEKTAISLIPAAKKLMQLLHSYTNSLGLIEGPPYAYWLDHALIDRRGANFTLNGHYLGALQDFAQIMDWLDVKGKDEFTKRAQVLRHSLQKHFWDDERLLFTDALVDGEKSSMISEHANAMALALNIPTQEQAADISRQLLAHDKLDYIKRASGTVMVTPAMSYFLHKGLCNYGFIDESFELLRKRFDKMLFPETNKTLWEEWWLDGTGRSGKLIKKSRSDAQTESAFPPALFAEYLLGVQPVLPGFKEVEVFRTATGLRHIEGRLPSPHGNIFIRWDMNSENHGELGISIPTEMVVKLDLASLGLKDGDEFKVNGRSISQNAEIRPYLLLSNGNHQIDF